MRKLVTNGAAKLGRTNATTANVYLRHGLATAKMTVAMGQMRGNAVSVTTRKIGSMPLKLPSVLRALYVQCSVCKAFRQKMRTGLPLLCYTQF